MTAAFPPGSTGLLGPNGAGKSSLIKGLLGLVPLSAGTARVLGLDVRTDPVGVRQRVGYMPEDDCLIPGLTGVGMVQYAGRLCGLSAADAMQRAHEVLFLTGLEEARYRKVETYSTGMRQRIKLAQALVHGPTLLFLDEPTSGLDPAGRLEILDLIRSLADQRTMNIVVTTHILVDIERTCERVVIMNRGRLLRESGMNELRGRGAGSYTVRVEEGEEGEAAFRARLEEAGCTVVARERRHLEVTLPEGEGTGVILRAARQSGAGLRHMVPGLQTLEDVFMDLIGEDEHADL